MERDRSSADQGLEQPKETKYKLKYLGANGGKMAVMSLDGKDDVFVFVDGRLLSPEDCPNDFTKRVISIQGYALLDENVEKITKGKTEFTVAELKQLQALIEKASSCANTAKVVRSEYGREEMRQRAKTRLEAELPSLVPLIACVNGELTPEQLIAMLINKV